MPGASELAYARQVAEAFGSDHNELVVDMNAFTSVWEEAVLRRGAPVSEPSDLPILLLSRLASRTVKMVLTGEGADELLGGYPKHRAEPWISMYQNLVPSSLHSVLVGPSARALPYAARRLKVLAGVAGIRDLQARMVAWFGGADGGQAEALYAGLPRSRTLDQLPFASDGASSALKRMLHFDQTSWLPDNLLERGDRMMMAGSIEGRMPFMDVGLAELVARFPDAFLTGAPKGKRVLRALAAQLLPREIIERKKVGFRVPVEQWFRDGMSDQLRDLLQSGNATVRQVCNAREIDRLVSEHLGGVQNHEKFCGRLPISSNSSVSSNLRSKRLLRSGKPTTGAQLTLFDRPLAKPRSWPRDGSAKDRRRARQRGMPRVGRRRQSIAQLQPQGHPGRQV